MSVLRSSFQFLPFEIEMLILYLSHHCILEAYDFYGFTGSQLENDLP